ncbi:ABC transporter permease [Salinispirillum sp. LH 10-3-1]|uniref:ABC transporter permease n=1 Tax=Salinispirillum sp. LH 10-3-1 TaxID=2952525 RepID=A0AB38YGH5_9GAMM
MQRCLRLLKTLWLPSSLILLLAWVVWSLPSWEPWFRQWQPDVRNVVYTRDPFSYLLWQHLRLVAMATLGSLVLGLGGAILVTRQWGRDFLPLVNQVASMGQTVPPVAVLALAVPVLGFGNNATIVALLLYGLLPIVRNSIAGLNGVSPAVLEAARGMGLSATQILWRVELPLASRVILAGVRTTVTFGIATAAIGSTVGARTLGDPIIAGLVNGNNAYVLQGAILIGLLAITLDAWFDAVAHWLPGETKQAH